MVMSVTISSDNHTHSPPPPPPFDDLQRWHAEPSPLTSAAVGISTTTVVCRFSDCRRTRGPAAAVSLVRIPILFDFLISEYFHGFPHISSSCNCWKSGP
ncbi:hypothetical protein Hanom_Chr01g00066031 [Helianthus anomalus]